MGSYYQHECFSSSVDAVKGAYSSVPVTITNNGLQSIQYRSDQWLMVTQPFQGGTETIVLAPQIQFPECNPTQSLQDGIALGALTGLVFIMAWCVGVLKRVIR